MKEQIKNYAYVNEELLPLDLAFLHVSDLAIQRGYGVFDFFKIQDGHPFFLDDYLHRFYQSATLMLLEVPHQPEVLRSMIYTLIEKNNLSQSGIKMILTGGYSTDGYQPSIPNLVITQQEFLLPGSDQLDKGISVITHEYHRELSAAKTINYSMGIWLIDKIRQSKASDVLYRKGGVVSEFPRSNLFIVKDDNTVVTPANGVLAGITRKHVLDLAASDYQAIEGVVTLEDVYQAKEAFLTSTTKRIVPIVKVDDKVIGNGKPGLVSRTLLAGLVSLEQEDLMAKATHRQFYKF
jgi:D-alanine transaminase/branched-chain amino acid aminotransferase